MARRGLGLLLLTAVIGLILALVAWNATGSPGARQVAASVSETSGPVRERVTRTGHALVSSDPEPTTWPVVCPVSGGERLTGTVRMRAGDTELVGVLDGDELGLIAPVPDFDGAFELDGYQVSSVRWQRGWDDVVECQPIEIEWLGAWIDGRVVDDDGVPVGGARVRGCGDWMDADPDGRFELRVPGGDCTVQAAWPQAARGVSSATAEASPLAGHVETVELVLTAPAIVSGRVVNTAGNPEPGVSVWGCGVRGVSDDDGAFELITQPIVCELRAHRMDGAFQTPSLRVEVDLTQDDAEVEFVLKEYPTGGMGISLRAVPQGMYVGSVAPGGPADRAGIVPGEVITRIDGQALAGMTSDEMVARGTGDIGASLEVVVVGETGERTVVLSREWVELWL